MTPKFVRARFETMLVNVALCFGYIFANQLIYSAVRSFLFYVLWVTILIDVFSSFTATAWPSRAFEVKIEFDTTVGPVDTCCVACNSTIDHYTGQGCQLDNIFDQVQNFYQVYPELKIVFIGFRLISSNFCQV